MIVVIEVLLRGAVSRGGGVVAVPLLMRCDGSVDVEDRSGAR